MKTQTQIAKEIAESAHSGQFRRDGKTPYIKHPEDVVRRITDGVRLSDSLFYVSYGVTDNIVATAWLHDVLEDTKITSFDLQLQGIYPAVIEAVEILTKKKNQSYDDYLLGVAKNQIALNVKIADMLSNLADAPTDKQKEKYEKGLAFLSKQAGVFMETEQKESKKEVSLTQAFVLSINGKEIALTRKELESLAKQIEDAIGIQIIERVVERVVEKPSRQPIQPLFPQEPNYPWDVKPWPGTPAKQFPQDWTLTCCTDHATGVTRV